MCVTYQIITDTAEVLMVIITRAYEFIKHFVILPITYLEPVTHLQMLDGQ